MINKADKAKHKEVMRIFKAFYDPSRLRVLDMLAGGEQCVCALLDAVDVGQSTLSHHMTILIESGIVKSRKTGKWVHYSIDKEGLRHAQAYLGFLGEASDELCDPPA